MNRKRKKINLKKAGIRSISLLLSFLICLQVADLSMISTIAAEISEAESSSVSDTETIEDSKPDIESSGVSEGSSDSEEAAGVVNDEPFYEDLSITSDYTLTSDMDVNDLNISNGTLDVAGFRLTVHGNLSITYRGSIYFNKGCVICSGDAVIAPSYYYAFKMNNINDYLLVNGDFVWKTGYPDQITSGTIEVKGDFINENTDYNYCFRSSDENIVILSGTEKQNIVQSTQYFCFNVLEITNASEEGVHSDKPVNAKGIIRNGMNLTYPVAGTFGHTLQDDEEIDTDVYLIGDDLDLNGHTLTIHGDLKQAGGTVKVNGGTLNVDGNYMLRSSNYDKNHDLIDEYSTGCLLMTNENDRVNVSGDFINGSIYDHREKLTNGVLSIKGSFEQLGTNSRMYTFAPSGDHKVVFNGTEEQSVSFANENSYFANVEFANTSSKGITLNSKVNVSGELDNRNSKVSGSVKLNQTASISNNYCNNSLYCSSNYELKEDLTINGDLNITNYASFDLKGHTLEVKGNTVVQTGSLRLSKGKIICRQNMEIGTAGGNQCYLYMTGDEDHAVVYGDLIYRSSYYNSYLTAGTLELKGDFVQETTGNPDNFTASGTHKTVFSGDKKQTISFASSKSYFNIVEIKNESDEGVEISGDFNCKQLIRNGNKVTMSDGGRFGWKLTKDETIDGDLMLSADELDLNGHTLTVKGDLIEAGGILNINGGTLNVDGDLRLQKKDSKESDGYSGSTGYLVMTNENDKVNVSGDFVTESVNDHREKLTNGVLTIKGSFRQITSNSYYNFTATNAHKTVFNGTKAQSIEYANENSCFAGLEFDNTSDEGITLNGKVSVSGEFKNPGSKVSGYIKLKSTSSVYNKYCNNSLYISDTFNLKDDLTVNGDLQLINYTFDLNGHTLDVNGNVLIQSGAIRLSKGKLICRQDLKVGVSGSSSSYLYMTNKEDHVLVYGDLTFRSGYTGSRFTAGTLELKGDFIHETPYYENNFTASGTHKIILSGDKKQTVSIASAKSYFNIVEIKNESDEGVEIKGPFNCKQFIRNGNNVTMAEEGVFGWTLTKDETISGDLILIADELDLNGHTLTVKGDLIEAGGTVNVNGGTLNVNGDFRLQKKDSKDSDGYSCSAGYLLMTNADDKVNVKGNFVTESVNDHIGNLTNGVLAIKGSFKQITADSTCNFRATNAHKTVFNGTKAQSIEFANEYSYFAGLEFDNTSSEGITLNGKVNVSGEFKNPNSKVNGYIKLKSTSTIYNKFCNNSVYISDSFNLKDDLTVNGDLQLINYTFDLNGHTLEVNGNVLIQSGAIRLSKGKLICRQDLKVGVSGSSSSYLYMTNKEDHVLVYGDLTFRSGYTGSRFTAGTLELKGDFIHETPYYENNFTASGTHKTVFSGDKKQTVTFASSKSYFNIVELQNHSEDGVYCTNGINAFEIITNDCSLTDGDARLGWTLTNDLVIDGDLYLIGGTLDLSGYSLTVTGSLIQRSGTVLIDHGTLTVEKDYRIQTPAAAGKYDYSYGTLQMTNDDDHVIVKGTFATASNKSHKGKLTAGTFEAGGDFEQITTSVSDNFAASDSFTLKFNGDNKQTIHFENGTVPNVVFDNASSQGAELKGSLTVTNTVSDMSRNVKGAVKTASLSIFDSGSFSGGVQLSANAKITKDLTFGGTLTIENGFDLNGHTLNVGSLVCNGRDLVLNGGTINCTGNFTIGSSGRISMKNASDHILVGGNFTADSDYSHSEYLTNGVLEIKGDFTQKRSKNSFVCSENHQTILSGKSGTSGRAYKQTVIFNYPGDSKFNKLTITRPLSYYSFSPSTDVISSEFHIEIVDVEAPAKVTELTAGSVGVAAASLSWAASSDNIGVLGYEVYRNNRKIATVTNTSFNDKRLSPETTYSYKVRAFDEARNVSDYSDIVSVTTASDTVAPDVPGGVRVKYRTGSSVTIAWMPSSDNAECTGYKVFRDSKEIAEVSKNEYKDSTVEFGTEYRYRVKAFDASGNISDFSDGVTAHAVKPVITSITPAEFTEIGSGRTDIRVSYPNTGNSIDNKVKLEYSSNKQDWKPITQSLVGQQTYSSAELYSSCSWDTSKLASGEYTVRCTLYDADNYSVMKEIVYIVDNDPPAKVKNVRASTKNGVVTVVWSRSSDSDCRSYNLYKADSTGAFVKVTSLNSSDTIAYTDKDVSQNTEYSYYVTAVDAYGHESEPSEACSVVASDDKESPYVTSVLTQKRINAAANIQIAAYDNLSVARIAIQYYDDETSEWIDAGSAACVNNKASISWDTTSLKDGEYQVRAFAWDKAGNKSTEEFTNTFTIDNTGPAKIVLTDVSSTPSVVSIHWEDVTDEDFSFFSVEQKKNGEFVRIGTEKNVLGMHIEGLQPDTKYEFRVVGYDDLGNRGIPSDVKEISTTSDNIAPYIETFAPAQTFFKDKIELAVTVKDNCSVSAMKLYYSNDNKENWKSLTEMTTDSGSSKYEFKYTFNGESFTDGDIFFKVIAVDKAGNESQPVETVHRLDKTAPQRISDLHASDETGFVSLNWTTPDEDVDHYVIYRANEENGVYSVAESNWKARNYYDTKAEYGQVYSYRIKAVDKAGNVSVFSNETILQVSKDTQAPKIYGVVPETESLMPQNPTIGVIAHDTKLNTVYVEYRKKDSNDQWLELGRKTSINGTYEKIDLDWNTVGLQDGSYEFRAYAIDSSGNTSDEYAFEYELDNTLPAKPGLDVVKGDYQIRLDWEKSSEEDFDHYILYRKSDSQQDYQNIFENTENGYTDMDVTPGVFYNYKLEVYDKSGNCSVSDIKFGYAYDNDTLAPTAVAPQEILAVAGQEIVLDGTQSRDNVRVKSFVWDMGNSESVEGARARYTFDTAGSYTAKLTVADAMNNTDEATIKITVLDKKNTGIKRFRIVGNNSMPLGSATVYMYSANGANRCLSADSDGIVTVAGEFGEQKIAVYKEGYLPVEHVFTIDSVSDPTVERITLSSGDVVVGSLSAHRMTLEEMTEAGVSPGAGGYDSFSFEVVLKFVEVPIPTIVQYIYPPSHAHNGPVCVGTFRDGNQDGGGCNPDGTWGGSVEVYVENPKEPVFYYIRTTQSVEWMKEMYCVDLGITNAASNSFVIEKCVASLSVPGGLSVISSGKNGGGLTQSMGSIKGGESKSAQWYLSGNTSGQYSLSATFNGVLMPFNTALKRTFTTQNAIVVERGSGLEITVYPETRAYKGETYYIHFKLTNNSDRAFYGVKTSFGECTIPSQKREVTVVHPDGSRETVSTPSVEYVIPNVNQAQTVPVMSGGDSLNIGVLEPGQSLYGTYKKEITWEGEEADSYFALVDAFVKTLAGADTGVKVKLEPIDSHISKCIVRQVRVMDFWGDPVNMATGAFTDSVDALTLHGNPQMLFEMNYDSLNENKGEFGYGWSHGFESKIVKEGGTAKVYFDSENYISFISKAADEKTVEGSVVFYAEEKIVEKINSDSANHAVVTLNSSGTPFYNSIKKIPHIDISGLMPNPYVLNENEDGTYTLIFPDHSAWKYDKQGRITNMIQPSGKSVEITYGNNSKTITDPISGKYFTANYNNSGLLTSVIDNAGRTVSFAYENDCLVEYTNALGETISYEYDDKHHIVSEKNDSGAEFVSNEYDDKGRVVAQYDGLGNRTDFNYEVDDDGNTIATSNDRNGNDIVFKSDSLGHITEIIDRNGHSTTYKYDEKNGNLLEEIDPTGAKTTYGYNLKNFVTSVTDSNGTIKMSYDNKDNLTSLTSPLNKVNSYTYKNSLMTSVKEHGKAKKTYSYDGNGMLASETTEGLGTINYSYTNGLMTSKTDLRGNTVSKSYDGCGNVTQETYEDGTTVTYTYDALGRQTSVTDSTGGTTSYTYNVYGSIASTTDANGAVTTNEYDDNNNLIKTTDPLGGVTLYEYDGEGNNTKVTNPDGTTVVNEYDAEGNVVKHIDEAGGTYLYEYDAVGRLICETAPDGTNTLHEYYPTGNEKKTTYADGSYIEYSYDALGRVTQTVDNLGNTYKYKYDAYNNVTEVVDPIDNKVTNVYDACGRLSSSTDANGNKSLFEYDANGNCIKKTDPNGLVTVIDYDSRNRPVTVTTGDHSVSYEYDALGRVTKYTDEEGNEFRTEYDHLGNITGVIDSKGNVILRTEYDAAGNAAKTTDALGVLTQNTYDVSGNLTSSVNSAGLPTQIETTYSYDALDRLISTVDAENGNSSYTYDSVGNITSVTYPNGGKTTYTYDSMGRMKQSVNAVGSKNTYTYNAAGLLEKAKDANGKFTNYTYDALGRITSFEDDLGTVSYTYDNNGNVLKVSEVSKETGKTQTITREYDCMDRVTKYTDARGNTVEYGYDTLGNLVTLTYPGGEIVRYSYYPTGRLKSVTDWNNKVTKYKYDGNGRLTKITRPDGSVETRSYDAAGRLVKQNDVNGEKVINSFTYSYDTEGNIIALDSMTTAEDTVTLKSASMEYDKANRLVKFNGENVIYDANGNMTAGPLDGVMSTFTYDCRNRLVSAGNTTYAYDAENNRISVTEGKTKTSFVVENNSGELSKVLSSTKKDKTTLYIYGDGLIAQNDEENGYLYYHYNNIGSTTAITDGDGKLTYAFNYGTYGELTSGDTHGIMFLYNGEYGVMTDSNGLYYMRARYYNADIKRFINQDVIEGSITNSPSLNKYAYCQGDPVSLLDPFGLSPLSTIGHLILDVAGFIPVVGAIPDLINAAWYYAEGRNYEAVASLIAAVPGCGDVIGGSMKLGLKGTCLGNKIIFGGRTIGYGGMAGLAGMGIYNSMSNGGSPFSFDNLANAGMGLLAAFSAGKYAKAAAKSQCFVAGTLVLTDDGDKPIEEIKAGDCVYSTNPETGESEYKEVVQTFENETDELVHIIADGDEIITTTQHPFFVPCKGWISAIDLRAGDILVLSNGEYVTVEKVQHEILESPVKVYNFEVKDYHTYYVGKNSVLVHNACFKPDPKTGKGYGAGDNPVRINGKWSKGDMWRGLHGFTPRGLGKPDIHHGGQMPGSAKHEIVPSQHRGNKALHPNKNNQGVTPEMRKEDRQLHWWYRAREQGAGKVYPNDIYD